MIGIEGPENKGSQSIQVVFILGTNYSGSHALSLLLSSRDDVEHVGELHRLRDVKRSESLRCGLCAIGTCPVTQGLTPDLSIQFHEVIAGRFPSARALIDNSKKVSWAERFIQHPEITPRFIHLINDPRALVRRWLQTYTSANARWHQRKKVIRNAEFSRAFRLLRSPLRDIFIEKWHQQNRDITEFLCRQDLDYRVITYHDLIVTPERTLRSLERWLEWPERVSSYEEFWTKPHHVATKLSHSMNLTLDRRWQSELNGPDLHAILESPRVASTLETLKLRMIKNGITAFGS